MQALLVLGHSGTPGPQFLAPGQQRIEGRCLAIACKLIFLKVKVHSLSGE